MGCGQRAREYVGTTPASGAVQVAILLREGLTPESRVAEFGCGCLHAGLPLTRFLAPRCYVGVDPNRWLWEEGLASAPDAAALLRERQPYLLDREDFRAPGFDGWADLVLSHSVLSHAAGWQLPRFLSGVAAILRPGGRACVSLRLAEGNDLGNPGSPDGRDTDAPAWTYPEGVWFSTATLETAALNAGLTLRHAPDHARLLTAVRPNEWHDWIVLTRPGAG